MLVEDELAPYRGDANEPDKFVTLGQNVMLEPTTAQTVALALHELVTNAAKYGALSTPPGRVKTHLGRPTGLNSNGVAGNWRAAR